MRGASEVSDIDAIVSRTPRAPEAGFANTRLFGGVGVVAPPPSSSTPAVAAGTATATAVSSTSTIKIDNDVSTVRSIFFCFWFAMFL